jgi:predicted ATPase
MRKAFRRLSIFVGGWTLEAAEVICNVNGDLGHDLDDILCSLIDNNLVIQLQEQEIEDQPRFGMLSTIREYAFERLLDTDDADPMHCQHAQNYLDFVTIVEPRIRSVERTHWQQVMQEEFGNIRGVLEWVHRTRKCVKIGQQIVITLGVFWHMCGYVTEGQRWCNQMMTLCDESTSDAIRAGLLCVIGVLAWSQGDHLSAVTSLDKSLELCRNWMTSVYLL